MNEPRKVVSRLNLFCGFYPSESPKARIARRKWANDSLSARWTSGWESSAKGARNAIVDYDDVRADFTDRPNPFAGRQEYWSAGMASARLAKRCS